jgi:hypothetical protein
MTISEQTLSGRRGGLPDGVGVEAGWLALRGEDGGLVGVLEVAMATTTTCPHPDGDQVVLSGTQVRSALAPGQLPLPEFCRAEVPSC